MEPRTPAEWKTLFESEAFARQTEYYGPLGVEYTPAGTHLRLWAPTAKQAAVNLYRRGTGGACVGTLPLQQQDKGVWSIYLPGDQHGKYYDFTLTTPFGTCNAADPYARSAGVNGVRSMIFDPARVDPQGWERDVRPVIPPARRSVWEVSVRDFSQDPASGVHTAWRGKFLAFTQHCTPIALSTGMATVSEQRPKPDISWMAATLGVGIKTAPSFLLLLLYRTAGALQGKIRG